MLNYSGRDKYNGQSLDAHLLSKWSACLTKISLLRHNVLAIKRKGMEPKEYSLSVWFMACTANHNYHLVARRHYILTTQGGWP